MYTHPVYVYSLNVLYIPYDVAFFRSNVQLNTTNKNFLNLFLMLSIKKSSVNLYMGNFPFKRLVYIQGLLDDKVCTGIMQLRHTHLQP